MREGGKDGVRNGVRKGMGGEEGVKNGVRERKILSCVIIIVCVQSQIYMMNQEKRRMELEVGRLKLQQQKSDKLINELKYNFQEEKRKRKKERKRKVRGHTYLRHHCEGVNGSLDYVNGSYDCVNESCDHHVIVSKDSVTR